MRRAHCAAMCSSWVEIRKLVAIVALIVADAAFNIVYQRLGI